jgi:uncharacterized protein (DUF1697 family)
MTAFIALLRGVNVGGTGTLAMSDLRQLCEGVGFQNVTTYIQSGNVVFTSDLRAHEAKKKLEAVLRKKLGKAGRVRLRTSKALAAILERNPFKHAAPHRLVVLFLDSPAAKNALAGLVIPGREEVKLSGREVFIHYPDGIGRSKLKLPFTDEATGRNLNTVRKLLDLSFAASSRP